MKRCFALLLAAVVLLGGCSADRAVDPSTATPMEPTQPPTKPTEPPFAVYEDTHSVEVLTHGAVKRYALEG
jgi:PBP1b-binding outer membrane lipoprotein LpoB